MKFDRNTHYLLFSILFFGLLFSVISIPTSFASFDLNSEFNLSSSATFSRNAEIIEDGNIYVVWNEGVDIFFKRSVDNGVTFEASTNLSNTNSVLSENPQVSASGNNVSVIWNEGGEIKFRKSTNAGQNFDSAINLSNNSGNSILPQTVVIGNNVFATWEDDTDGDFDILFTKSNDSGTTFDSPINLSSAQNLISENPKIAAQGSNIYVIWSDYSLNGFNSADVILSSSTSSGSNFSSITNLSSALGHSTNPQIAVSGNHVYVVWSDSNLGNNEIQFRISSDSGFSFGSTKNISNNSGSSTTPQISASGNNVHIVWKDDSFGNNEILYVKSEDNGSSFGIPFNLSQNDGLSESPQISDMGNKIAVIWKDDSFGTIEDSHILIRNSNDGGNNFSSFQKINESIGVSINPQITSSGDNVFLVWGFGEFPNGEIFFRSGGISSNTINFDSSQYTIGQNPIVTVKDESMINSIANEIKLALITSDSDLTGITLNLQEIDDSGMFTNSFLLTNDPSSSSSLHAEPNNIITIQVESATGSASVVPIGISFDFTSYDYGDIAHLTVTDKASNLDPFFSETVLVNVTSDVDSTGIQLILTETGPDTGVFSGNPALGNDNTDLVFMTGNNAVNIFDSITINSIDFASNLDSNLRETIQANVVSASDTVGITITLTETTADSGIFQGTLTFSETTSNSGSGTIQVKPGDFFSVIDPTAEFASNGIILPNPDQSNGAIIVGGIPGGGSVLATYKSFTDSALILDQGASGGGGGGLVRPSLVVNALAGLGGGGSAYSSPTLQLSNLVKLGQIDVPLEVEQMILNHDSTTPNPAMDLGYFANFTDFSFPLVIDDKGFILSGYSTTLETQMLQTKIPHTFKFMYYESDKIQHFSLYTNLRDANTAIHQSDTQILYNDGKDLKVVDPNEFFKDVSLAINRIDDLKNELVLEITFAKEMDTTDIILRAWDPQLNSFDTYILDAIAVVSDQVIESPIPTYEEPVIQELRSQKIPTWIKNNAAWWSDQQIDDDDFVAGIEYLIKNGIIKVPGVEIEKNSVTSEIPDWIKNNAEWWSESLITDRDFIEAMQWLVANGVIKI